jgi:uncharacterized membrane protein
MLFQAGHPLVLLLVPPALAWICWLAWKSDVQVPPARRWSALAVRCLIVCALLLALAELQFSWPLPGMNVFYLLDASESVPPAQLDFERSYVNRSVYGREHSDQGGLVVFGSDAAIEHSVGPALNAGKAEAVVDSQRTDIAGAVRLAAVAFPQTGQKRIVLLSDGNENLGDALAAAAQARSLGVSIDVVPLQRAARRDVAIQKLSLPSALKKGQTFEAKIFINADQDGPATVSLYRNEQLLGKQAVQLSAGKNLFSFPQTLSEPGFYSYDARVDAPGDVVPQNNRASGYVSVKGDPRILFISSDLEADRFLLQALRDARFQVKAVGAAGFPGTLAEMQSYDSIFLSNIAAGDLGSDVQKLLESAVHDFGVGLVCVGGEDALTAGAYRGTPLETVLPLNMELDSKKALPSGALALVIDKSGSMNGAKIEAVKEAAMGAVAALGNDDYVGILAFDAGIVTVAEMQKAANKKDLMGGIAGLHASGGTAMYAPLVRAREMLKNTRANLKHCIVLTDGDSLPGDFEGVARAMAADKITISTVGVGTDLNVELLQGIAALGKGRFYSVTSPETLPQIFIKETALVLKVAINEEPFRPQLGSGSELVRGIRASDYPMLRGHVVTTPKDRAEVPLRAPGGDPLLAHWQYGLGRAAAFTSDARAKWAKDWVDWPQYGQFWAQVAGWSMRRLENSDFTTELAVDGGDGRLTVDALDARGDYRNFLALKANVVGPAGERFKVDVKQTGPGHYEARFPARDVGLYMLNLVHEQDGAARESQFVGATMNYSPEYSAAGSNLPLLRRLAELTGGRVLNPENPTDENPYRHDRIRTYRAVDLWEWLLRVVIVLFPLDVALRRIYLERGDLARAARKLFGWMFFWRSPASATASSVSLAALLARRDEARAQQPAPASESVSLPRHPLSTPSAPAPVAAAEPPSAAADSAPADVAGTTSRLLEAKRRARSR